MDKRRQQKIIGMVMAFMLALTVLSLGLLLTLNFSVFHEAFLLRTMESSNYYAIAHRNIEETIGYRATPFDIPEEVLTGLVEEESVREDARRYVVNNLRSLEYTLDHTEMEERIDQRVRNYLDQENMVVEEAQEEAIDEFTSLAVHEYRIRTEMPFIGALGSAVKVFNRLFPILLAGILTMGIFFGVFLMKLLSHRRFLAYLGHGFSGGGLLLMALPLILYVIKPYERLNMAPESFYHFVMELISSTLGLALLIGGGMIILALVFYILDWRNRNQMRIAAEKRATQF